jgi:hypothetical protein
MVQGTKKVSVKKNKSSKTDKRNREKAAGHKARIGLTKAAKKPGVGRGDSSNKKLNQKLVREGETQVLRGLCF